jgi:hypothetical protein
MFDNLIEDYGQFGIMILLFVVGAAVYLGYLYYQKQEDMKRENNLKPKNVTEKPPPLPNHPKQSPDFVPAETFKGEQKGYVFKNGDKGTGYYKEN